MSEEDLGVDVLDVSGTDGIFYSAEVFLDGDSKVFWSSKARIPFPEEVRVDLSKLIGDGNATVTVGIEMKESENWSTAGCSAYVKLTCGQDEKSIESARAAAHKLALSYAKDGHAHARYVLDKALGRDPQKPDSLKTDKTPKKLKPAEEESKPDTKARGKITLKGRPNFDRR